MEIGPTLNTALTLTSGICWTVVYILIIIRSFKDKTYGMPFWALAFNISWEAIFSLVLLFPTMLLQTLINRLWLLFDVAIVIAYCLYGQKEWPAQISKKWFYPYSLLVLITAYLFVYLISVQLDQSRGTYAAFIQNLMMSWLFILLLIKRQSREGQSVWIALFKMIGTLAPTILYGVKSPFVLFLGSSCFVADMIYFIMVLTMYKKPVVQADKKAMLWQE
ncbi:hypothetical protein FC093_05370 [Ilyomonas limi]|uniref:Uncharacterized protein n=1 Tax=Ilyomonas limi TaxID=2575867 RepID=A0A4U3L5B0_9BACT|nr:hypothetical protein [Ilyomonas limi]TKK70180.1 hypothetical protein FC093_05370 [Ilyomonas limi]